MSPFLIAILFCCGSLLCADRTEWTPNTESEQRKPDTEWIARITERHERELRDRRKELYGTPVEYRPVVPPSKSRYLLLDHEARPYDAKQVNAAQEVSPR